MAAYRIVRRPGVVRPDVAFYDVERRVLWWWELASGGHLSLELAKESLRLIKQQENSQIRREVVYQEP